MRWLARRFDRPAIPDKIVETFQLPLENVLNQIDKDYPEIGLAFSHAVYELRVHLPTNEEPPFDVQLIVMIKRTGLSAEEADAIDFVKTNIRNKLDPAIIHFNPEVLIRTDEEIPFAEHRATKPLFLEYLTYKGEEPKGIRPYERT